MRRESQATSGWRRLATATATRSQPMTRVDASIIRRAARVAPSRATAATAEREEIRSRSVGCDSGMARYSTDVVDARDAGPPVDPPPPVDPAAGPEAGAAVPTPVRVRTVDLDWRSIAVLLAAFVGLVALTGLVRSAPRTITALIIGGLLALALNPLVEATQRRVGCHRAVAVAFVLVLFGVSVVALLALVGPPAVRQARSLE